MSDEMKREAQIIEQPESSKRREFLRRGGVLTGAALMSLVPDAVRQGAWAAGSDAPEKTELKIG
ncbi:MAG: nitrate ABC transporter substrate-binding protein, partial [Betaproteobacteria bacterium]|nr:nitrate ABC transporter substrate-binding protein [Betaproteobacteria bacterium]